jgi:hypothetical protein
LPMSGTSPQTKKEKYYLLWRKSDVGAYKWNSDNDRGSGVGRPPRPRVPRFEVGKGRVGVPVRNAVKVAGGIPDSTSI